VGLVSLPTLLIMLLAANLLQIFLLITLHVIISNVMCRGSGISTFWPEVNQQLIAHHHPFEAPPLWLTPFVGGWTPTELTSSFTFLVSYPAYSCKGEVLELGRSDQIIGGNNYVSMKSWYSKTCRSFSLVREIEFLYYVNTIKTCTNFF
jgi:hypothetical protein